MKEVSYISRTDSRKQPRTYLRATGRQGNRQVSRKSSLTFVQRENSKHIVCCHCASESHLADVQPANMKMQNFTNGRRAGILVDMQK